MSVRTPTPPPPPAGAVFGLSRRSGQPAQAGAEHRTSTVPVVVAEAVSPARVPDAGELVDRMRQGDREAAIEFIACFGEQIRRRVRGKLGSGMRRIFDSQDIMSTVSRRLDRFIASGRLEATDGKQLWSLVFKIIDSALVDKSRVYRKLHSVETEDSEFAHSLLTRMRLGEDDPAEGPELAIESAFKCLKTDEDREVLSLWLNETPQSRIADLMDSTPTAVRQRWTAIKLHLREQLANGTI